MLDDWMEYGVFARFALVFTLMIFIVILVFDMYLLAWNTSMISKFKNITPVALPNKARVYLNYGNGRLRLFEGEVMSGGLTLIDVITSISEVGNVKVAFQNKDGRMLVETIDSLPDSGVHYWEITIPSEKWSKRLDEVDANRMILTGGMVASLIYH